MLYRIPHSSKYSRLTNSVIQLLFDFCDKNFRECVLESVRLLDLRDLLTEITKFIYLRYLVLYGIYHCSPIDNRDSVHVQWNLC